MDISTIQTYNASPSVVVQVLLSSELAARQAKLARIGDYTHTVGGFKATTMVSVPAKRLSSKARTFTKNDAKVTIIIAVPDDNVMYTVGPHGLPAEVSATLKLPGDTTTTADPSAILRMKIPLLGGKIRERIAGMVDHLLAKDVRLIEEVIEEQGP